MLQKIDKRSFLFLYIKPVLLFFLFWYKSRQIGPVEKLTQLEPPKYNLIRTLSQTFHKLRNNYSIMWEFACMLHDSRQQILKGKYFPRQLFQILKRVASELHNADFKLVQHIHIQRLGQLGKMKTPSSKSSADVLI